MADPGDGGKRVRPGWRGRFFEDFAVGDVYEHPLGRTVTETDNIWMTLLTQNTAPIHFDSHYAAQTEFGRRLVDSTFTLALVTGQSVTDVSQNVMANLGWDEVRLPAPVFEGDTTGFNQEGTVVITSRRTLLVYKRDHAPQIPRLRPRESE
jgi:itaconyl-CoA hydratase